MEDDIVPLPCFFNFCEQMLNRYQSDTRVTIVSGRSHQSGSVYFTDQDYIFTHYAHTMGWATWKRVWSKYDIFMRDFPEWLKKGGAYNIMVTDKQSDYINKWFSQIYHNIEEEATHSWDAQWLYTFIKEGGLGIVPCYNLVNYIGEDTGTHGGHTKKVRTEALPKLLRHPKYVLSQLGYEELHFNTHINTHISIFKRIRYKISHLLKAM